MKHTCFNRRIFFFHVILLLWMSSFSESATFANESDRLALLDFKSRVTHDPHNVMASWNNSLHFCSWFGVTCSRSNGRVVILNLQTQKLVGSIPPSIGNLTFLTGFNLINNSFHGEIPQEVGHLLRLQHLNLSLNSFHGEIPTNLTHCSELRTLALSYNGFTGKIPNQLSSLTKLETLGLGVNNLTGTIPAWIGNFSSLNLLSLALNNLNGAIPDELGQLSRLEFLQISTNNLSGIVPQSIYNISSIYFFSVTENQLEGYFPQDIALTLPNLIEFYAAVNRFIGHIPVSLSNNASRLEVLDISYNGLTGTIPQNLGSNGHLNLLNFHGNKLGTGEIGDLSFFDSLTNNSNLEVIDLAENRFGGQLPASMANLSVNLYSFTIGGNLIHGGIPVGIVNLVNLKILAMEYNQLSGTIPENVGKLQKMQVLDLSNNKFQDLMPFSLGNLTALTELDMDNNRFEGSIPPSLGNCTKLLLLNVSTNNLSGAIPREIMALSSLSISLSMSKNSLSGSIPVEVGKLNQLVELDLSENRLSGEIPSSLGNCVTLGRLYLEGNAFEGTIPLAFKSLKAVEEIDLSRNKLSGQIPDFLSNLLFLRRLNLSYNDFEGEVPQAGIFANATTNVSVIGNNKLCGGVQDLHLPACTKSSHGRQLVLKVVIPVTTAVIFVLLLCALGSFYLFKSRSSAISEEWQSHLSYSDVVKSTDGFSEENLIGSSSFGSVYKGKLPNEGTFVAIKVLNLQQQGASRSFIDECNALRSVRHRNLLKIITACSTIDHQGNDFKCLVFEFMPNGNLDQWLHHRANDQHQIYKKLSLVQRLNIAINVASALEYLHHQCETPLVHCDIKPSNVLLDENMTAHVADFGLARFLPFSDSIQSLSVELKGSIGYIPPEYGIGGQASIYGDIYSYGILLLEMFTGKSPIDDMFKDDQSLHNFIELTLPEHAMDVVDLSMLSEEEMGELSIRGRPQITAASMVEKFIVPVMKIGLLCSATSPTERMVMTLVVNKLIDIKQSFLKLKGNNKRRIRMH